MAKKRYTRVEEEIIQILDKVDREPAWKRLRPRRGPSRRPPGPRRPRVTAPDWIWIGVAFGLALIAIVARDLSAALAMILAIASILAFFAPIVLRWRAPSPPPIQRWRGKDIDLPPRRAGIMGEIRYQLWRLRNRD
ncbi:hypothetical protein [Sphaerobacter thermophilus]|uniref:hypothetical protein n=1 Tax=Sphaerobacter thermophilus TaxID=2057 RepID=UPI00396D1D95